MNDGIYQLVKQYFAEKVKAHGATAKGVDWNDENAQLIRFVQLAKILPEDSSDYSLLDYGCGYGAFLTFLRKQNIDCRYIGFDCVSEMIEEAKIVHEGESNADFICERELSISFDYAIASGVFNQKGDHDHKKWTEYTINCLDSINKNCRKGFAVNFLTSYSDEDKMRSDLYYPEPGFYFDHCKQNFAKNVALLHDYGAYEFTLLVRKEL